MSPETAAYLAEAESPTHIPIPEVQAAVLAFLEMAGRLDLQVAHWQRLLQMASITEADEVVRRKAEYIDGKYRVLRREIGEAERELRQAGDALRRVVILTGELRELAEGTAAVPVE